MFTNPIGKDRLRTAEILRTHGLTPLRSILTPKLFQSAYNIGQPAKTILIPEVVFWLMALAAFGEGSMAGCVTSFWASLRTVMPWLPLMAVTEEAFSIARRKLPLRFFLRLFTGVSEAFSKQFDHRFLWKGLRLLGIDGMDVNLPRHPHVQRIHPPASNQHGGRGRPQARLVGLVGLLSGACYAFRWTSLHVGEQASARRLLRTLRAGDLLLADRNFPDKTMFASVLNQCADFLIHLPSNRFLNLERKPTPSNRPEEWYSCVPLGKTLQQQYPHAGSAITVRVLRYQMPGFRPSWLITSLLDSAAFLYEELVELYHQRWRQETFHREWKHTLELSNLRSRLAAGLLKEVLVQLTINNVVRWIMAEAAPPPLCPVHLKFLEAKRLILASVPAMTAAPVCLLPELYRELLRQIARQRILIRPGRSYERKWDIRGRPKGHGKIAAPAKLASTKEIGYAPI